jgi:2-polyprenyl-6-methoxyphenol hydroxylase-like FAD-dependent oxidoreductase
LRPRKLKRLPRLCDSDRGSSRAPSVEFLQQVLDARGPEVERAVIRDVLWGSRFLTRHSLASRYRAGRVLLAGDAAHEHSALGGQGMNLGIHDAIALGRALSNVLEGGSTELLNSYAATQRPMAGLPSKRGHRLVPGRISVRSTRRALLVLRTDRWDAPNSHHWRPRKAQATPFALVAAGCTQLNIAGGESGPLQLA